jgi:hypothetical protein
MPDILLLSTEEEEDKEVQLDPTPVDEQSGDELVADEKVR